jgi:hypothetical protein
MSSNYADNLDIQPHIAHDVALSSPDAGRNHQSDISYQTFAHWIPAPSVIMERNAP